MATRTDRVLDRALITTRTVTAGQTVSVGRVAKDGVADHEVQHSADGADAIGVIYALGPLNGAAGDLVQIVYLAGACIVPVKVGTGGATRGKAAACVADGVTNAAADAVAVGFFTQSGVAGDLVGMVPARARG